MKNRILFKTLIFLLALCMAVSICGCSNADSGSAQASSSANSDAGFSTDKMIKFFVSCHKRSTAVQILQALLFRKKWKNFQMKCFIIAQVLKM